MTPTTKVPVPPACTAAELISYLQRHHRPDEAIFAFLFTRHDNGGIDPNEEEWAALHRWAKDKANSDATQTWGTVHST